MEMRRSRSQKRVSELSKCLTMVIFSEFLDPIREISHPRHDFSAQSQCSPLFLVYTSRSRGLLIQLTMRKMRRSLYCLRRAASVGDAAARPGTYPALVPSGTCVSGRASTGVILSE